MSGDVNEDDDPNASKWPPEAENVCYSSREAKNVESGGPETLTRMTTRTLQSGHRRTKITNFGENVFKVYKDVKTRTKVGEIYQLW